MKYYYSIEKDVIIETKIKRSKFVVYLHYVETIKETKEYISKISTEHKTATHNCWAYIVGEKGETFHSSDAGEPPGTAGKPILNRLKNHNMTNIVAVVTRYFGGVKLGIRGLIEAYSECIENAVKKAYLKKVVKHFIYKISTSYGFAEMLKHKIKDFGAEIRKIEYSEKVKIVISVEKNQSQELEDYFYELQKSRKIEIL